MGGTRFFAGLIAMAAFFAGCSDIDFDLERYKGAVRDGFEKIPQSVEIEEVLGDADHFISYSGSRSIPQDWSTEVYFEGRYKLTMQVEVKVDRRFSRIVEVVGKPTFAIAEATRVQINPDGTETASFGRMMAFGPKEWEKVYKAKGDFSVIGFKIIRGQPVPNFDKFVAETRRPRVQVHPEKKDH